jgi:hypothetical protein
MRRQLGGIYWTNSLNTLRRKLSLLGAHLADSFAFGFGKGFGSRAPASGSDRLIRSRLQGDYRGGCRL